MLLHTNRKPHSILHPKTCPLQTTPPYPSPLLLPDINSVEAKAAGQELPGPVLLCVQDPQPQRGSALGVTGPQRERHVPAVGRPARIVDQGVRRDALHVVAELRGSRQHQLVGHGDKGHGGVVRHAAAGEAVRVQSKTYRMGEGVGGCGSYVQKGVLESVIIPSPFSTPWSMPNPVCYLPV